MKNFNVTPQLPLEETLIPVCPFIHFIKYGMVPTQGKVVLLSRIAVVFNLFANLINLYPIWTNFLKYPLDLFFFLENSSVFPTEGPKGMAAYQNLAFRSAYHEELANLLYTDTNTKQKKNNWDLCEHRLLWYKGLLEIIQKDRKAYDYYQEVFARTNENNQDKELNYEDYLHKYIQIYSNYTEFESPYPSDNFMKTVENFWPLSQVEAAAAASNDVIWQAFYWEFSSSSKI